VAVVSIHNPENNANNYELALFMVMLSQQYGHVLVDLRNL